ncbi:MAG: hypothetical protein JSS39_13805 [Nitrospira sp.]|nr:hypothetical protein [Nitrospira sp.]
METDRNTSNQAWEAHRIAQLRRFRALSLRQKLQAVEGMADVARRFEQMRREGAFRSIESRAKPVDK